MPETAAAPEARVEGSAPSGGGAFSFGDFFDTPAPQPAQAPPAAVVEPPKTAAPAAPAAEVTPPATEQPAAQPAEDAFDAALRQTLAPAAGPTWDEAGKAAFKSTFGVEDPAAFKETFAKTEAELGTLREANDKQKWAIELLGQIEQRFPALAAAIAEAQEERDPFEYLSQLGDPKMLGKKAEELTESQKVDTYLKKHFTDAERNALRTGDYTELEGTEKDLKAKVQMLLPVADHMHTEKNAAHTKANADKLARIAEGRKAQEASITGAIAHASADPYVRSAITPEILTAFRNGSLFNGSTYKEDGTYADPALTTYLKGQRYDSDIKRAIEYGKKLGAQAGSQEVVASLSTKPGASRQAPATPAAAQPQRNSTFVGIGDFLN